MKSILITTLLILLGVGTQAGTISPGLEQAMLGKADSEELKVLVVMRAQPDVAGLDQSLRAEKAPRARRHTRIVTELQDIARNSQKGLLQELDSRIAGKSGGGVRGYTPHWIVNSVVVVADIGTIRELAARVDVDVIEADLVPELIAPVLIKPSQPNDLKSPAVGFIAPGVQAVNAPRVWHELGIDGTGTLVANMDSGVDGAHPALADRWQGNFTSPTHSWADHAQVGSPVFPVDSFGHGTHVMGTITGAAAGDTIGVAPGAHWMASNAVFANVAVFDNAVIAGFEFFADPDGNPATTDDVPDVVQNSWGVTEFAGGDYIDCDSRWWDVIDHCEAAGVVVVWSAGNEGPDMGTLRSPPDRATSPTSSFSVGSAANDPPYNISSFSSRGPSGCGGDYAIKPEVVGPGENVYSSFPGGQYGFMDGTSMAGPHVAGIVALMRQANPDLDVISIKEIIMETAIDLGIPGEDNDSGHGMVDAYAAVFAALNDIGTIAGTVTDAGTGLPVPGATVVTNNGFSSRVTDAGGHFELNLRAGFFDLVVTAFGYESQTVTVEVVSGEQLDLGIALNAMPHGLVSGTVYGPDGAPLVGAAVNAAGTPVPAVLTDSGGFYQLALPLGEDIAYDLMATAADLAYVLQHIGLDGDRTVDFHLPHVLGDGFESGGFLSYPWVLGGDTPPAIAVDEAHEGFFSVRTGDIGDGETSELSLDYYVQGEGEISFWLKLETEASYDYFVFLVDGQLLGYWSGVTDWIHVSGPLPTGQHTLQWVYQKDSSVSLLRDAVWIDRIEFPGTGVAPVPEAQIDPAVITMALNTGYVASTPLRLSNVGGARLDYQIDVEDFVVNGAATEQELIDGDPARLLREGLIGASDKAAPIWLSVEPASGHVQPGVSRDLDVVCDTTQMPHGTHYALLEIQSNDPASPVRTVPVILTVGGISDAEDQTPLRRPVFIGAVPNPFNPTTELFFELPAAARVTLAIYDVTGRQVKRLVDGTVEAGVHRQGWDGSDARGRSVASGIYYAKLSVAGESIVRPMTLVR